MYQHFAAVTIAITLAVGFMADGEAQEKVKAEVSEKVEKARAKSRQKTETRLIARRPESGNAQPAGSFGPDVAPGTPNVMTGGSGRLDETMRNVPALALREKDVWLRLGITKEQWMELDPETQRKLAGEDDVLRTGTEAQKQAAMSKLSQASRARTSGINASASEGGSDY